MQMQDVFFSLPQEKYIAHFVTQLILFSLSFVLPTSQSINQSNLFKVDPKNTESYIETTNKRFVFLIKIDYTKNLFAILI